MSGRICLSLLAVALLALVGCGPTASVGSQGVTELAATVADLSNAWEQVGEATGFDPAAVHLADVTLDYTSAGSTNKLLISGVTRDDRLVTVSGSAVGRESGEPMNLGVEVNPVESSLRSSRSPLVATVLEAIDNVGVENILRTAGQRQADFYTVHALQYPNDQAPGIPSGYPAFIWDGGSFTALAEGDSRRLYGSIQGVFLVVFPMAPASTSSTSLSDDTATTQAWGSMVPSYLLIPN